MFKIANVFYSQKYQNLTNVFHIMKLHLSRKQFYIPPTKLFSRFKQAFLFVGLSVCLIFGIYLSLKKKEELLELPLITYPVGVVRPPAVLLKLKGGLGNQLFQYACSYALARKQNWPLYIFSPSYELSMQRRRFGTKDREFALDHFNIPLFKWNLINDSWSIPKDIRYVEDSELLSSEYFHSTNIVQLSDIDYCQSEVFFAAYKNEIIKLFQPSDQPLREWARRIDDSEESVAVHVRRGDFVRLHSAVPISYIQDAMKNITIMLKKRQPTFFVFSDDINFVKKKFLKDRFSSRFQIHFVSNPGVTTSLQEFVLMSRCKHAIISNSSFSWWAAYLIKNSNKIVIAADYNIGLIRNRYFRWQYKYLYYPTNWFRYDPFKK